MSEPAKRTVLVEVAVDSAAGAEAAQRAGADRIELCAALELGGLTPTIGLLRETKRCCTLPVAVMVRPRAGDFVVDEREFGAMCADVNLLAAAGADLIVTGILTADGDVDADRLAQLVRLATPLPVTFHRAVDHARDAAAALDAIAAAGARRVLTSGQRRTALDGAACIASLVQRAAGRVEVMAGAGVRAEHAAELVRRTGVRELHLSATAWRRGASRHRSADVAIAPAPAPAGDDVVRVTDEGAVARLVRALGGAAPAA